MKPCAHCAIAKVKQKNVNKDASAKKAERPNKRWSHDIATIKPPKKNGLTMRRPDWHILVDEFTGTKFLAFYSRKNDIVKPMCERLQQVTGRCVPVNIYGKIMRGRIKKSRCVARARTESSPWRSNTRRKTCLE